MNRAEFERQFHAKTLAYQPQFHRDPRPVVCVLPEASHTPAGHALAVALTNQLARAHRTILYVGDLDRPLLCRAVFGAETLADATAGLARAINPHINVDVTRRQRLTVDAITTVTIGPTRHRGGLALGARGWRALLGEHAVTPGADDDIPGAALAACLASAAIFHRLLGHTDRFNGTYSLWDFGAPGGTDGPTATPLDVGRVLQVGAGGVGAALDFWLGLLGVSGEWTIADGDTVEASNLNRQLVFLAKHAGYPAGLAANKSRVAAAFLPQVATPSPEWYGADPNVVEATYDVVLPLANERGARELLQERQPAVLLHATTSPNYQAQFHRHLPGADDCIRCRLPGEGPRLACSEAPLPDTPGDDAALPFLSATAGLLLYTGLTRLAHGALADDPRNLASLDVATVTPALQRVRCRCRPGCTGWASPGVRHRLAAGTRFAHA
jgi:hypothetical protein